MSHLCETPACHVPVEHGLEQFSERPEHLGRWDREWTGRGSAFRRFGEFCFSNQRGGGVEDAHVVHQK